LCKGQVSAIWGHVINRKAGLSLPAKAGEPPQATATRRGHKREEFNYADTYTGDGWVSGGIPRKTLKVPVQ